MLVLYKSEDFLYGSRNGIIMGHNLMEKKHRLMFVYIGSVVTKDRQQ
jgi:hypothetical protein